MKRLIKISVIGIFLLPVIAFANPPMVRAKKIMHEIGLSDQQIEKVQGLRFKADREQVDIRSDLDKAHIDMQQLLSADKPNDAAVFTQIEKIGALEVQLKKNRIGLMLEVRKLMTPEQWEKIEMIWAEEHGKDRHFPGRHGDAAQTPAGPAQPTPAPAAPKVR
jgi:Spy/CpxP family protein refolding chaperone